jgi:hypothetical protein
MSIMCGKIEVAIFDASLEWKQTSLVERETEYAALKQTCKAQNIFHTRRDPWFITSADEMAVRQTNNTSSA